MTFSLKRFFKSRNVFVDLFAILFGIGAWVAINGLWVELPILVEHLPESWSLPSYMTIVIQTANIGAILYGILHKFWPNVVTETVATVTVMVIGTAASLLLVYFWEDTLYVAGEMHSVGLLILVFFLSMVDCTSSVVFIPFMARFSETYLISYFIGEGFSGFFPSIVALAQGVGGNPECKNSTNGTIVQVIPEPNFSVEVFFYALFAMVCVSFAAFLVLRLYPWAERNYSSPKLIPTGANLSESAYNGVDSPSNNKELGTSYQSIETGSSNPSCNGNENSSELGVKMKLEDIRFHLIILTWINFLLNGVLMSVQSYSCLPYGNVAYHLSVTLSNAANPIACFLAFFIPNYNKPMISVVTVVSTLIGLYVLVLAVLSPTPPMAESTAGVALLVLSWILIVGLMSHTKTSIAMLLHEKGSRALFWYGSATQIGSFIGSLLMFLLVNVYELFKSYYPC